MSRVDVFGAGLALGTLLGCVYYLVGAYMLDRVDRRRRWRHGAASRSNTISLHMHVPSGASLIGTERQVAQLFGTHLDGKDDGGGER